MSHAAALKKLNRRVVTLPTATRLAREAGALPGDETLDVTIRKVTAMEVMTIVSTPPSVFKLAARRDPSDDADTTRQKLEQALADDPNVLRDTQRQTLETQRAIIALGVTSETVVLDREPGEEEMRPEDFGDDFAFLYDAIVDWSSLPYQRLGGTAAIETFPAEPVGGEAQPDGEALRHDPQPPAGA